MTHPLQTESATPRTIAAAWFARRRSGEMTEQEGRELAAWLDADPAHRKAWDLAHTVWGASEGVRSNPAMLQMRERAVRRRRFTRPAAGLAIAASLLAAVFGGWAVVEGRDPPPAALIATPQNLAGAQASELHTTVGQRRAVTLADGTVVTLDTDTAVRVRQADKVRLVELERGQAFFDVAKDRSRPFLVRAAGRTVVALGTEFGVRVESGRMAVTLIEGRVRVEAPINGRGDGRFSPHVQTTELTPGSRLEAKDGAPWAIREVDTETETSWMTDKLVFQDAPLTEVVAELNRYSHRRIVLANEALGQTPVSGSFRTDDIDGSLQALTAYRLARVTQRTADTVVLGPVDEKSQPAG